MKYAILFFVLFALLVPGVAFAEEEEWEHENGEREGIEMQRDQKVWERNFNHETEMQNLEREKMKFEMEMHRRRMQDHDGGGPGGLIAIFLLFCLVVNILAAVWVYLDIRARNAGSGIWIVITLLAGLFGALIYGVIRLGEMHPKEEGAAKSGAKK